MVKERLMLRAYLKSLRDGAKLSQEDLGALLGFEETTRQSRVSNMERGATAISGGILARWLDSVHATDGQRLEALRMASLGDAAEPTQAAS